MDEIITGALWVLLTQTGRAVAHVVSLGRWRGESLLGDEALVHSAAGSLWFTRDGRIVLTLSGQLFLGVLFYVAFALGLFALAVLL